ncbi:crossover junction endonuclease EME1-like [Branchiostoma lanceolatum]|uniref:crossover junction endonuclease EME1-like n=1 Tax=Branchiostoma lanceolatum TaxID=7740 RepID=UPI003454B8D4
MTEESKEKKKKKRKKERNISRREVDEVLVDLQLWQSVNVKLLEEPQEMADLVRMYSKAVAEAPFKRLREQSSFSFHIETSGSSVKVDKDGRGLLKVWSKHIEQMRNVSAEMSAAIVAEYPSPQLLLQAYQRCSTEQEAQLLLKDIMVRRGAGVLATCRRIGPEVSKRVHTFFTSSDGEVLLQSAT